MARAPIASSSTANGSATASSAARSTNTRWAMLAIAQACGHSSHPPSTVHACALACSPRTGASCASSHARRRLRSAGEVGD